jgi:DNA polymerase-3 subunit alpha
VDGVGESFVHLHVHTEYSMLDGAARLKPLLAETARMGMPALAMTDHGNLFGAYDFYRQSTAAGIKPIIGMEAYLTPGTSRFDRSRVRWAEGGENDVSGGGAYTHMTLLAADADGLRNLFKLASLASLEGFFYKPRIDRELLQQYGRGIIATTGCLGGEVQTWLRIGDFEKACVAAAEFRDIFGAENFYLELMDHGVDVQRRVNEDLLRLGKRLGLPPVATNDLHYTFPDDADAHAVLLCVQSGSTLADPKRFKFDSNELFLKSPAQMRERWDREVEGACDATLAIAERVGDYSELFASRNLMPQFPVPNGESEESWLRKEVAHGLARRFPGGVPEGHQRQAEYELNVICSMGFPGYFLVVADLCQHARSQRIRVGPGRGSAAGAVIAYALGITELDPIAHKLLFERFLNPDRISMPDIDIDFDERRRGDMIRYATEKYGEERVAQIITYSTIKAKAAVKDAGRVLGYPFALGDRITKAMPPPVMGKDMPLTGIFDPAHQRYPEAAEFRSLYQAEAEIQKVVDTAKGLEGLKRQWGVHAAGVILSREQLVDVLPIQKREQDGAIITQWDMNACESIGLLKMDFLGLRNLTVMDDCLDNIKANRGVDLVLEDLELHDKKTFELLARGDTLGVFQLDGGPMRSLLRSMVPDSFDDISAVLALYRPGPMGANAHNDYADRKNKRKPVVPIHRELAEPLADILDETFGLIVYQEQVMAIAQKLAGYSLGAADLLRRAMGKKKKEILDKEYVPFSDGMRAHGYSDHAIKTLWDILVPFSDYAFNKAHTAGYGLVSFWTAYLKANFPAEYMAALLTSVGDDKDKSAVYLAECRRMGIKVLPPDVNASVARFSSVGEDIRFGLAAVRNVGTNVVESIIRARKEKGAFTDFYDFLRKVDAVVCNKKTVESLIKAVPSTRSATRGVACSRCTPTRSIHSSTSSAMRRWVSSTSSQTCSARTADPRVTCGHAADSDRRVEQAGPAHVRARDARPVRLRPSALRTGARTHEGGGRLHRRSDGGRHDRGWQGGQPGRHSLGSAAANNEAGQGLGVGTLEDLDGAVEVLFFPNTYELVGQYIAEDAIVVVRGRIDRRDEQPRLMAMDLRLPDLTAAVPSVTKPLVLQLPSSRCTPPLMKSLKQILASHPGSAEVHLRLINGSQPTVLRLGPDRVAPTTALMADLKALLGPTCLQ